MKKNILYFLAVCFITLSCSKTTPVPLSYSVTDIYNNAIETVYITDTGSTAMPVDVNFLTGNITDSVRLVISGLPAHVKVTPDTFSALPTYTENFVFTADSPAVGTYPVKIIAYTPTTGYKTYSFNLVIVQSANCATLFNGTLNGSNACSSKNYTFSSAATGSSTILTINNFGGYGVNTNAVVTLNCNTDSLYIASQNIGNGVTVQGAGTFTSDGLVIYYTAANVPSGGNDACTLTYTK